MNGDLSNVNWFYLVPLFFFGPVFLLVFYNFGIKLLFKGDPEGKELIRQEREQADRVEARRARKAGAQTRTAHPATKPSLIWLAQGAFFTVFAVIIGMFSNTPSYRHLSEENAVIKLSVSHPGEHKEACVKRSKADLAKLAPNMRAAMKCSRERWPVLIELEIDGQMVFKGERKPAGLSGDMSSSFYESFTVSSGEHLISVRINDDRSKDGFTKSLSKTLTLSPAQNLAIGFNEDGSGFYFR